MQNETHTQEPMLQSGNPEAVPMLPASHEADRAPQEAARPSCWQSGWHMLVVAFKVGLAVILIAALVAAVYIGWPQVYAQFVVPVQQNTARLAVVETTLQSSQQGLQALQTQMPAVWTAQAGKAATLAALAPRMAGLEDFTSQQATAQATLMTLSPRVDTLEASIKEHSQALAALQSTQASLQAGDAGRRAELERQVILLKSAELLSRARLFLYESNYGLAKQDTQAARDLLAGLPPPAGQPPDKAMTEVMQQLDLTLSRLPEFPVAASDSLDIAWQVLLGGTTQPTATPAPQSESSLTPTGEVTPTPTPTP